MTYAMGTREEHFAAYVSNQMDINESALCFALLSLSDLCDLFYSF